MHFHSFGDNLEEATSNVVVFPLFIRSLINSLTSYLVIKTPPNILEVRILQEVIGIHKHPIAKFRNADRAGVWEHVPETGRYI